MGLSYRLVTDLYCGQTCKQELSMSLGGRLLSWKDTAGALEAESKPGSRTELTDTTVAKLLRGFLSKYNIHILLIEINV